MNRLTSEKSKDAGSGMTGIAAMEIGRDCVLIDNNMAYAKLAFENLQNARKDATFEVELLTKDESVVSRKPSLLATLLRRHGLGRSGVYKHKHAYQSAV
jgi:hypothetical protein